MDKRSGVSSSRFYQFIYRVNRKAQRILGTYQGNLVTAYWSNTIVNFGDLLTPLLLRHYGLRPIYAFRRVADVVAVGSVLDDFSEDYSGYIVGAGLKRNMPRSFSQAKIYAVRGALTRENLGAPRSTVLGDPGLLAEKFLLRRQNKRYLVGIIPHYVDKEDTRIQSIFLQNKNDVTMIDVQRKPQRVISDIDQCHYIVSSSLHGLVVADSLGVPNAWLILSDKIVGGEYKFQDYASAFGRQMEPHSLTGNESTTDLINMTHPIYPEINENKRDLDRVFNKLKNEILLKNGKNVSG